MIYLLSHDIHHRSGRAGPGRAWLPTDFIGPMTDVSASPLRIFNRSERFSMQPPTLSAYFCSMCCNKSLIKIKIGMQFCCAAKPSSVNPVTGDPLLHPMSPPAPHWRSSPGKKLIVQQRRKESLKQQTQNISPIPPHQASFSVIFAFSCRPPLEIAPAMPTTHTHPHIKMLSGSSCNGLGCSVFGVCLQYMLILEIILAMLQKAPIVCEKLPPVATCRCPGPGLA